ncbi:autotransporter outer membrane beta-barrel domain-containing protein [Bartonella raoultii]|uniref:autotransporter outer membrane beta-barrel domain-containing protein n=1 Tax=Bartonella raoultii TaxID=1457020 RepID=UPI001ABAF5AC|nr:autotransporter outer membrane beta-barrel domain-containing protein [Bartonella raoultii]
MIKVLKSHVCLCALTTSVFFFIPNINTYAQDSKPSCSPRFKSYSCDVIDAAGNFKNSDIPSIDPINNDATVAHFTINSNNIVINSAEKTGKNYSLGGALDFNRSEKMTSAVIAQEKVKTIFSKGGITGDGKSAKDSTISQSVFGVKKGGFLSVSDSKINVANVHGLAVESSPASFREETLKLQDGSLSGVVFEKSNILLKGHGAHGLHFRGGPLQDEYEDGELLVSLGEFQFKNTALQVPDGTAIYSDDARRYPYITASEGSRIFADMLFEVKNNSYIVIDAYASFLAGGAHVEKDSYASVELFDKSQWTVRANKNALENRKQKDSYFIDSSVSAVRLVNSSIFFHKPQNGYYQRLKVGNLGDNYSYYAYAAGGDARLYVNAYLTAYNQTKELKADQLVIYGDVYGSTKLYVRSVSSDPGVKANSRKAHKSHHSISVVRVHGKAQKDSFKLPVGYIALKGAPYRYRLKAYASVLNNTNKAKGLSVDSKANGEFWDFRLEREYIKSRSKKVISKSKKVVSHIRRPRSADIGFGYNGIVSSNDLHVLDEMGVSAVVPQVPTYLLLPNALFHSGLMDISNQNKQLETFYTTVEGFLRNSENPAFFVRGYGGNSRYVSDLSDLEYGYGGDLGYHAVEAGVSLKAMESADYSTNFGIMGTYGKISLQPQDVVESKKSAFDKWFVTAYGSMHYDTGFYLNGLFSYGLFKGDVLTFARGKTATLKGNALSASLIGGKAFIVGYENLIFDPQVQVVYQNLQFDKASDIDGFDIEMGKPSQLVMRVGGRLSKTLAGSQTGDVMSFNGKIHFAHSFGEKQFVNFGDKFQLSSFGSSLEAGLGFNAQLSSKFALHGDVTYQHQLSKAGFSGVHFSGGLRYRF